MNVFVRVWVFYYFFFLQIFKMDTDMQSVYSNFRYEETTVCLLAMTELNMLGSADGEKALKT